MAENSSILPDWPDDLDPLAQPAKSSVMLYQITLRLLTENARLQREKNRLVRTSGRYLMQIANLAEQCSSLKKSVSVLEAEIQALRSTQANDQGPGS